MNFNCITPLNRFEGGREGGREGGFFHLATFMDISYYASGTRPCRYDWENGLSLGFWLKPLQGVFDLDPDASREPSIYSSPESIKFKMAAKIKPNWLDEHANAG